MKNEMKEDEKDVELHLMPTPFVGCCTYIRLLQAV